MTFEHGLGIAELSGQGVESRTAEGPDNGDVREMEVVEVGDGEVGRGEEFFLA